MGPLGHFNSWWTPGSTVISRDPHWKKNIRELLEHRFRRTRISFRILSLFDFPNWFLRFCLYRHELCYCLYCLPCLFLIFPIGSNASVLTGEFSFPLPPALFIWELCCVLIDFMSIWSLLSLSTLAAIFGSFVKLLIRSDMMIAGMVCAYALVFSRRWRSSRLEHRWACVGHRWYHWASFWALLEHSGAFWRIF